MTIAIAYASVGSGHRVAAEALATELQSRGDSMTIETIDALEHATTSISGNLLTSTFGGSSAGIYDAVWGSTWAGRALRILTAPLLTSMFAPFSKRLLELAPDVVLCTHAGASVAATRLVKRNRAEFDVVNVATDYGVHGYWPRTGVTRFCVADDTSAESLTARGFDPGRVTVTGIPVRRQFTLEYDQAAARSHFGLPEEGRVILAIAGSMMPGPYERFKEALAVSLPALATLPQTTVAVVTGRDELFAEELRSRSKGFGTTNVHVFGFVDNIAPLMSVATLALAKPGGAVCAECLASGLPLVLVGPAAGQENANARALTEAGAAVFASDPRLIAEYVRKVITKPSRLKSLREGAEKAARPFASADIVDVVLGLHDEAPGANA